jgi:hypothetical protein
VTLAEPVDTPGGTARVLIEVGDVENFDTVVLLLRRAGAFGLGGRRFEARPPLAAGQVQALRTLDGFEDGAVTVTVDPADVDVWRVDPSAPEIVVTGGPRANLKWWQRNSRPARTGAVSVAAGTAVPLDPDVPFTVEVIAPAGQYAATYRFDGQVCAVTVNDRVNVVGNADLPAGKFTTIHAAHDGARTTVKLRAVND